ncbi:3-hydroxyacyl-CoA dehydrogenase NAD-binding domain-containing protein, partial [Staphylococcus aureus]|uniref:3-hydroxyacyl-CoA dehydrogenase NAD-binding domain-containing protein n=1 Tax=Staphylococcus aureus TaxID=1280 RepID=UPI0028CB6793
HAHLYIQPLKQDIQINHPVSQQLLQHPKEHPLFPTNTSPIPINPIPQPFNHNHQQPFFPLHFFNPPPIIKLLELIP